MLAAAASRYHGVGLVFEPPQPLQPIKVGMTDAQPGLKYIQFGAIRVPFPQRRGRIGRPNECGYPRCLFLFRRHGNQSILFPDLKGQPLIKGFSGVVRA
jgi:hypothetical protein